MANREALRELQSRLASRLQAARTEGVRLSWLALQAGGRKYIFPLHQAGEIFPWDSAHAVPYTQDWFLGVSNLRGGLFGIVDLSRFVLQTGPSGAGTRSVDGTRLDGYLVALNAALNVNCALLVDGLEGLRSVGAFASTAPAPDGAPVYFGNLYTDPSGEHWQEINLQLLSQQPDFLSISA
ncbi:MAG: chemotaxis protein CheW [Betaproteobacteria bacterium]